MSPLYPFPLIASKFTINQADLELRIYLMNSISWRVNYSINLYSEELKQMRYEYILCLLVNLNWFLLALIIPINNNDIILNFWLTSTKTSFNKLINEFDLAAEYHQDDLMDGCLVLS